MKNRKLMVAVVLMGVGSPCLNAQGRLTIAVFDYTGVPAEVMSSAVGMARRTFSLVGIETVWVVCQSGQAWPKGCNQPVPVGLDVTMNVMPKMGAKAHLAGSALVGPGAPRAYASYATVKNLGEITDRPVWLALGCVMTHEIGHLLGLQHRDRGLMRAALSPRQLDEARQGLGFTGAEAKQLREGVRQLTGAWEVAEARPR